MISPTEKHRVLTDRLEQAVVDFENASDKTYQSAKAELQSARAAIHAALAKSEREGMKRAAEIARGNSGEYDFQAALAEGRDFDYGFHNGKNHAGDSILAEIILSEAGEG